MEFIKKIKKYCVYVWQCHKRNFPIIRTMRNALRFKRETGQSAVFTIMTNYGANKDRDSFLLDKEYFDKAGRINGEAGRDALNNKTVLYERCPQFLGRRCIDITQASEEESLQFIEDHDVFVGKRNYGSGGERFSIYETKGQTAKEILDTVKEKKQKLLEGFIVQHDSVAQIYPNAVNTIRIHTANNGIEVKNFLKPKMRIGCGGACIDIGSGKGGYRLVLNEDGTVDKAVYVDKYGFVDKTDYHQDTGVVFSQLTIPYVKEALELTRKAAEYFPETPFIGWDIAITPTGPVIVEGNATSGCLSTYQFIEYLYNGKGLKHEFNEMLDYAESNSVVQSRIHRKKDAEGLAKHAEECLGLSTVYLWGGLGDFINEELINKKAKQYPQKYTKEYCEHLQDCVGKDVYGFDCSGLIKNYMMGGLHHFALQDSIDYNSAMLLDNAEQKGDIATLPEQRGICLYMKGHVGIYVGNGRVIESTSNKAFGDGVVETKLKDRKWTHWFFCPTVEYSEV